MIVAIDGPAGSGKTTVAKRLADRLKISRLDTGATYRVLTLKALKTHCDLCDRHALAALAKNLDIKMVKERVYLDGRDVTRTIRKPVIDKNISIVVSYPQVRKIMVDLQRNLARNGDFVVEGRDITTVVFPDAEFKFYLDADFAVRAKRRADELTQKKIDITFGELSEDLRKRDEADKNRTTGPLRVSNDAVCIDTTHLSIDEVVNSMLKHIKK